MKAKHFYVMHLSNSCPTLGVWGNTGDLTNCVKFPTRGTKLAVKSPLHGTTPQGWLKLPISCMRPVN